MARPPRLEFPGAVYHVLARGNEQRATFRDDVDRERYLERLARYRTCTDNAKAGLLKRPDSLLVKSLLEPTS